jgi:hypothetical protein
MPPHPRPVADVSITALLADAPALTKGWVIALIAVLPLERASELPLAELASDGPRLCAGVLAALGDDAQLMRLGPGGDLAELAASVGRITGQGKPAAVIQAVERLRLVLWEALMGELRSPSVTQVAELASRLSHVCSVLAEASSAQRGHSADPDRAQPAAEHPSADEQGGAALHVLPAQRHLEEDRAEPQIEIHDARGEGAGTWMRSVGARLSEYRENGLPFAVLLVEMVGSEQLGQLEEPPLFSRLDEEVREVLSRQLRPADVLSSEQAGRYWLIAGDTDQIGARTLAQRLARAVRASVAHRGLPMEVAIGIAVCPDDGLAAAELATHADVKLYAARACGLSVAPADDPQQGD